MAATLIGFTGIASRAQTPGESLLLFPQWEPVFTLRTGGGYKDNVFLSHSQPQASAFISGGGDVMVLRAAPTGPQFNFFASADVIHFLSTTPSHDEYTVFAQAEARQNLSSILNASIAADYLYQDQFADVAFLDASNTNITFRPTAVRSHALVLRPAAQLDLPREFSINLETPVTRLYQEAPLDDQWNAGFKVTLTRSYGHDSRLSLSYEPTWRFYDHDPALTSSGLAITNSHRQRFLQETLLTWRHYWDEPKHWRSTAKVGGRVVEENAGGYFDYVRLYALAQIQYRSDRWHVSAESRFRQYHYENQPFGPGQSKRQRTEWTAAAQVERKLGPHLKFAIGYEHEQTLSNDDLETYTVNTVTGSLHYEF
jgi:hypothetical protein